MVTDAKKTIGAVMVVGGGIAGQQAALDTANAGFKVYLVEKDISLGGIMAKLDKTFPTNDCSTCMLSPKLIEVGMHPDIEIITQAEVKKVEGEPGNFSVTLLQQPRYIDLEKCNACGDCAKVCPVEMPSAFDEGMGLRRAAYQHFPQAIPAQYAIKKFDRPPCVNACPANIKVQGYVQLIKVGKYEEAVRLIMDDLPLPGVLGRICPHPCESACRRQEIDEAIAICNLKRFAADQVDPASLTIPMIAKKKEKIAIIGSGPAGLSCAYQLARRGYQCTIFEALPVAGGMLRVGIPDYRLPKTVLDQEIAYIQRWGVEIKTNTALGADFSLDDLFKNGYKAVFLGLGCHMGGELGIPGEEAAGVIQGVDLLRQLALGQEPAIGKKVVVIGGGNVAFDVARSARRLGSEVTILYRRTRTEMPANIEEIEEAECEDIDIQYLIAPQEVIVQDGVTVGLQCIRMELGESDVSGRRRPIPKPGTEFVVDCDMIVPAIGQRANLNGITGAGIRTTRWGTIEADPITYMTSREGVFAAGDVHVGPWIAIGAVAGGKEAAESIDRFLRGRDLGAGRGLSEEAKTMQHWMDIPLDEEKHPRQGMPQLPHELCCTCFDEVKLGYTEEQARAEAARCLNCGGCSECMQCVAACQAGAIIHDQRPQLQELQVGAIILAPGYRPFDARQKAEYGYGRYANVVTALEFERILSATGPFHGHVQRPSDGQSPKKIAWIQCVGSRDKSINRNYCSSVCCMYATKQSIIAKEHDAQVEPSIFFIDMRAHGKGFDRYYERAQEIGVRYVRSMISRIAEKPQTKNLELSFVDANGTIATEEFDLVVLSVGLDVHPDALPLGECLGIETNPWNYAISRPFDEVATSRDGVFTCGVYQAPKDIPETVTQALSAAASAAALLTEAQGSMLSQKTYPPERDVSQEEPRVGVFVCHCGINIAGVVDVAQVTEYVKTLPYVTYADHYTFTCANDSLEKMKEIIEAHKLNRVVVASCSPRTHEPLFQDNLRQAGLNKYLFEMANIRDQDSWVHQGEPARATELAKDLIRMAVGRALKLESFRETQFKVVQRGLVIGGGLAGMTAALTLAEAGYEATLVEKTPELGGMARRPHFTRDGHLITPFMEELIRQVRNHPRIEVLTEAKVVDFNGHLGRFISIVQIGDGSRREVFHGAAILAPGAVEYRPEEYLYGQSDRIMTLMELEEKSAGGWQPTPGGSVVMILCVGSREPEHPYCSRVCCTKAINNAIWIKEKDPSAQVTILYRDIRTFGFNELYYQKARELGVRFIRFDRENKPEVITEADDLRVSVFDQNLRTNILLPTDCLVLAAALRPSPGMAEAARVYKLSLDMDGFFLEAHIKLRPLDFTSDGFFLAGTAHSPKFTEEAIAQGKGAAARAMGILSRATMEISGAVAYVNPDACVGCLNCLRACPYGVPEFNRELDSIVIDPASCHGCGNCCATCPAMAIDIKHSKGAQFESLLKAI
ncbi:FAD-dependent oxidoreductase [Desulfobacca acetoxidans]